MKNFLTSLFLILSISLFGQVKFATYQTAFTGETYNASISFVDSTDHLIFVDMFSLDPVIKRGGIAMDYVDHLVFLRLVSDAKTKYNNWVKTAKQNGVKDLEKPMDISCYNKTYFGSESGWYFQLMTEFIFHFKIIDGNYLLIIKSGSIQDYENPYITHDGLAIAFSSSAEIDNFLNNLSLQKVFQFRRQQELFRD